MRSLLSAFLLCTGLVCVHAQSANTKLTASVSRESRMSLVKNSLDLPSWHEKSFWPIYENYLIEREGLNNVMFRTLAKVAGFNKGSTFEESLHDSEQFLKARTDVYNVRKEYYQQMAAALNGVISLQFLQTELMLDMMETAQVYQNSRWGKYAFHPGALTDEQRKVAKRNLMSEALQLTADESPAFWKLYEEYEAACDAIIGEDYSMVSLYAGEPSDYTPALAKRLGSDLVTLLERERKLREDFFYRFRNSYGANIAARFLAWEDYYATISKMHAWAEAP